MEPVTDARGLILEEGDSIIVLQSMGKPPILGTFSHYDDGVRRIFFVNIKTGNLNRGYQYSTYKVPSKV